MFHNTSIESGSTTMGEVCLIKRESQVLIKDFSKAFLEKMFYLIFMFNKMGGISATLAELFGRSLSQTEMVVP